MKKKAVVLILGIIGILGITMGLSYAFFGYFEQGKKENTIELGDITFKYTEIEGLGNGIRLVDGEPISDELGKEASEVGSYFDFKVEGKLSRSDIEYEVVAEIEEDSTMPLDAIKFYITELDGEEEKEIESTLGIDHSVKKLSQFHDTEIENVSGKTIYQETILRNTKNYIKNFRVRMWIDESIDTTDSRYEGTILKVRINVYANSNREIAALDITTKEDTRLERVTANQKYLFSKVENEEYQYTLTVPNEVATLDIEAIPMNTKATAEVIKLSRMYELSTQDANFFKVIVVSSDHNHSEEYILRVIREKSRDKGVLSLGVEGYSLEPVFDPDITEYTLALEEDKINLYANPTSEVATVSGDGEKELELGENQYTIRITAENSEYIEYHITIDNQRPTAPVLSGGTGVDVWVSESPTIEVLTPGGTISGIKEYEYYIDGPSVVPDYDTVATGTLTKDNSELTVSQNGVNYIYYRTVSNHGFKSEWSSPQVINLDTTEPTIAINTKIPSSIEKTDNYDIIGTHSNNVSGITTSCTSNIDGNITNTSTLSIGTHTVTCTITTGTHASATATKTIVVTRYYIYNVGEEYTSKTGGWIATSSAPHTSLNVVNTNFAKKTYMYNRITTVWSASNLSTVKKINIKFFSKLCFYLRYYVPSQTNTGQGIYYGLAYSSYSNAYIANFLPANSVETLVTICFDTPSGDFWPFIEIMNGHTTVPYNGWIADTHFYLYQAWLE